MSEPATLNERLSRGEIVDADGKLYAMCQYCEGIVRLNKPFLGSLHVCSAKSRDERQRDKQRAEEGRK